MRRAHARGWGARGLEREGQGRPEERDVTVPSRSVAVTKFPPTLRATTGSWRRTSVRNAWYRTYRRRTRGAGPLGDGPACTKALRKPCVGERWSAGGGTRPGSVSATSGKAATARASRPPVGVRTRRSATQMLFWRAGKGQRHPSDSPARANGGGLAFEDRVGCDGGEEETPDVDVGLPTRC
jgi:hypothetical protein